MPVPEAGLPDPADAESGATSLAAADDAFGNPFDALFAPTFDLSTLVDVGQVDAIANASTPQPLNGSASSFEASGVTPGDIALAFSDGSADDAEAAASTFDSTFMRPPAPPEPLMPPDPLMHRIG